MYVYICLILYEFGYMSHTTFGYSLKGGMNYMVYELKNGRAMCVTYEELQNDYVMYELPECIFSFCESNPHNFRSGAYLQGDMIFFVLDILDFYNIFGETIRMAILVRGDMYIFVSVSDSTNYVFRVFNQVVIEYEENKLKDNYLEEFLYRYLECLIREDSKILENMENHMSLVENSMFRDKVEARYINEILSLKRELMYIRNYYEQLIDFGELLQENENGLMAKEAERLFSIYVKRVKRLLENVKDLKEYTVQLRETYDAMLDYDLNRIMKLFTVVTTIFLPLTLIVGWYGMNFEYMPELHWKYGYITIIILSMFVAGGCFVAFKKYKLL